MDRASDTQAGAKHRCTAADMRHFRAEVMELCQGAWLYQIDLLGGSRSRVADREYWVQEKGQLALNAETAAQGKPPTKFETDKGKLRREIQAVLATAASFEDFAQRLLQRGITVKESRGRLPYLTPDRDKPITARKLGDEFDHAAYRQKHEGELLRSDAAAQFFKDGGIIKLPFAKTLTAEIEALLSEKNAGYTEYQERKREADELLTVKRNIGQVLHGASSQRRDEHGR